VTDTVLDVLRSPLGLLAITLGGYQLGRWLQARTGGHALAQPVLVTIVVAGVAITLLDVDYADYRSGTELIAFWLGPATVALAIPLHRQADRLKGFVVPLLVAITVGAAVSIVSGALVARALGADELLEKTLATKAATTPVAIAVADAAGGIPPLAAVFPRPRRGRRLPRHRRVPDAAGGRGRGRLRRAVDGADRARDQRAPAGARAADVLITSRVAAFPLGATAHALA
jgi:hypothetical protein